MRTVLHIIVGAALGCALGILIPLGIAALILSLETDNHGGATPFAIMVPFSGAIGIVAGAIAGYRRLHPGPEMPAPQYLGGGRSRPEQAIADFHRRVERYIPEDQRRAVAEFLPLWVKDYRRAVRLKALGTAAFIVWIWCSTSNGLFFLLFAIPILGHLANHVVRSRTAFRSLHRLPGAQASEQTIELPYSLRTWSK